MEHFGRIRARLSGVDRDAAARLGDAVARDRFLVRGIGAFEAGYLDHFADLTSAILDAYDEVFGFKEWSKVPGKKIRIRVHLEDRITRPPHFAPQFRYHSEIDMPVIDPAALRSPTSKGHMMFYGLCHEFGHLIAMWGDRRTMEDHHAWAHYTGVVIVEHLSGDKGKEEILADLRDLKWRTPSRPIPEPPSGGPVAAGLKSNYLSIVPHDPLYPTPCTPLYPSPRARSLPTFGHRCPLSPPLPLRNLRLDLSLRPRQPANGGRLSTRTPHLNEISPSSTDDHPNAAGVDRIPSCLRRPTSRGIRFCRAAL